jgi:ubiquinone/menaquinone biosynthesis C-methylase UbiE
MNQDPIMETDMPGTAPTFASFYDFYDGPEYRDEQCGMYRQIAKEAGGAVLELACGTGIITIDLARAGFEITGLDLSPEMLDVAREKVARESAEVQARIRLVQADMKQFNVDRQFAAVFIPCNSFGYLTDLADRKSCLRRIRDHLEPGGLLVIEERNYTPETLMGMSQRMRAVTVHEARVNPATGKYTTFNSVTSHIDFAKQTVLSRKFIDEIQEDGSVRRYMPTSETCARNHYFGASELQLLIEQAGFTIRDVWGGADRQPLGAKSYNMIFVARRS